MESTIRGLMAAGAAVWLTLGMLSVGYADAPQIETESADLGYGEQELSEDARFEYTPGVRGRVDRRSELNSLADRLIGWPSGYIPPGGTVVFTNRVLYGQRVAVSPVDGLQVFAEGFLPIASQTFGSAGMRFRTISGDAWNLTVGLQGRYRRTNFEPGTADAGLGVDAVLDVVATDDTSWSVGVAGQFPLYQAVEDVDLTDCDSRREWAEGACGITDRQTRVFPTSGYWAAAFGGINHFVTDWLSLNVEAFTGVSQGNFFALESALSPELTYSEERELVEETDVTAGLGPLGIFTLGVGSTWHLAGFAIQPSLYLTNYRGDALVLPYLSASFGFDAW